MTLDAKERGLVRDWSWPAKLGTWLGHRTLADLVLEAVRRMDGEDLNPPVTNPVVSPFHSKALLAILTYCYANGVFGSEEAEWMMREDAAFKALCGNQLPDWRQLRRFRRHNHPALHQTLAETFQRAWSLHFGAVLRAGTVQGQDGSADSLRRRPMAPLLDQASVDQEVEERIERAMFIDQMSSEF